VSFLGTRIVPRTLSSNSEWLIVKISSVMSKNRHGPATSNPYCATITASRSWKLYLFWH